MAASTSDLLTQATTNSRPVPTTVTSTRAGGGTTLQCNALTGWATGSKVHFCTYKINTSGAKVAGSQLDMTGIVSGTQITNIVVKAGTDGGNAVGDIVEASPTAAYANDVYSWGTQDHDTQGRHKQLTDTNGNAIISLSATANAVNNLQVANAATGNGVIASAIGTDTNINIDLQPKGTGVVGVRQATTGLDAQLQARGSDTNINLVISAKGTGVVKLPATTITKAYTIPMTGTITVSDTSTWHSLGTLTIAASDLPTGSTYQVFVSGSVPWNHVGMTGGGQAYAAIFIDGAQVGNQAITGTASGQFYVGPLAVCATTSLTANASHTVEIKVQRDYSNATGDGINTTYASSYVLLTKA